MGDEYSILRADMAAGFKHDERIRALEVEQAESKAILANLPKMEERLTTTQRESEARTIAAQRDSENRLMKAIQESKPKSPWPAVSAVVAAVALILTLAAAIYSR